MSHFKHAIKEKDIEDIEDIYHKMTVKTLTSIINQLKQDD